MSVSYIPGEPLGVRSDERETKLAKAFNSPIYATRTERNRAKRRRRRNRQWCAKQEAQPYAG